MVLINWLCAVGDKLRIIQVTQGEAPKKPDKITTRTVRLSDLATEIQAGQVKALADRPDDLSIPFSAVFEAAGLKPQPHGWSIEKLRDLLRTEAFKGLDRTAVQKALVEKLALEKVPVEDLVKDAMARDKVLDTFEDRARQIMRERTDARKRKLAELHAQIEEWHQWHGRKVDFEKEMAWAIGYLLDRPVISVDQDAP